MRRLLLIVAFGLGCVILLPGPARSLDNCFDCTCSQMKAWAIKGELDYAYGMRIVDPADDNNTIAIEHVPATSARLLSTLCDAGDRKAVGSEQKIYKYTKSFDLECKYPQNETYYSLVKVASTDWNQFATSNYLNQVPALCIKSGGDPE